MYLQPIPITKNNVAITTIVPNNFIFNSFKKIYNGTCMFIKTNYYCKNTIEIKDKCITQAFHNNLKQCLTTNTHVKPFENIR